MRGIDIEEDTRDDDALFFEKFFEKGLTKIASVKRQYNTRAGHATHKAVVKGSWQVFQIQPHVERRVRWNSDF